jgi:integral membrane sensor domain MASE1
VDHFVAILLIVTIGLLPLKAVILYAVFRDDIQQWWRGRQEPVVQSTPTCLYCRSTWTRAIDEGQTRWEEDDLVLVTTYECDHCHLPFWHVERVPMGSLRR